jgi:hypothetical protein
MIASEQEELDKELADKVFADRDEAMDAWLKFRFKQTREEFLASRRMIKSTAEHAESAISQQPIRKPIENLPSSSPTKLRESPKKNVNVNEKARELKLLKSYNFIAKSGEKITITKLSRELCGNEGDLHRNSNCKLARECLGFVILRNINYFSCVKCEQYCLDYRVLSRY